MKTKKPITKHSLVLSNNEVCDLMMNKIKEEGNFSSGTYNNADPTHYERGAASFSIMYGYKESEPDPETGDPGGYPIEEVVEASFNDCTWGVEIEFKTSIGKVSAYFSRDSFGKGPGEWMRPHPKFWRVFKDVLFAETSSVTTRREVEAELRRYE